ncbi:MAG: hypothetical protein K9M57_10260 [Phycisphaerae bacterium]|nr:hypothetical protein [Phycisphaerae bacterium]
MQKKYVLKLTLIAFCLTYFHQVFAHVGSVHHEHAVFASSNTHHHMDLIANEQGRYYQNAHDDSANHDSDVHNHITELKPKKLSKDVKKNLIKHTQVICFNISHQTQLGNHSKYVLIAGGLLRPGSAIPLYLCAQSFLI